MISICVRHPGRPDWANFRLLGNCLVWVVFLKITKLAQNFWATFSQKSCFRQNTYMDWAKFWAIFSQPHLVTLPPSFPLRLIFCTHTQEKEDSIKFERLASQIPLAPKVNVSNLRRSRSGKQGALNFVRKCFFLS
jgi:hypothetical protein